MEHENKPLTLEELKQMDGQPVWCEYIADTSVPSQWMVVEVEMERCGNSEYEFLFDDADEKYGRMWIAYAQKPIDFDKWKPCKFCIPSCNTCSRWAVSPGCCAKCKDHNEWGKRSKFCPECGRPLTDEAREMMERRVIGE